MNEVAGPLRIDEIPLGDPRMKEFVAFHWKLYEGNKYWVPQFDADLLGNRLLGLTGLLTPQHPYHKSSIATHFLALRGKDTVGRISVVVNNRFNEYYDVRVAFFGSSSAWRSTRWPRRCSTRREHGPHATAPPCCAGRASTATSRTSGRVA